MEYMIQLGLGGLKRVLKNKDFTKSKDVERTIEEYRIESNPLLSFLDEAGADAVVNEPVKAVYFKYREFCITNQFEPLNRIEFSRQVTKALNFATKDKRINGAKEKIFVEKSPRCLNIRDTSGTHLGRAEPIGIKGFLKVSRIVPDELNFYL